MGGTGREAELGRRNGGAVRGIESLLGLHGLVMRRGAQLLGRSFPPPTRLVPSLVGACPARTGHGCLCDAASPSAMTLHLLRILYTSPAPIARSIALSRIALSPAAIAQPQLGTTACAFDVAPRCLLAAVAYLTTCLLYQSFHLDFRWAGTAFAAVICCPASYPLRPFLSAG